MLISNKNSNFWFKIAAPLNATAIFYFQFETNKAVIPVQRTNTIQLA